MKSVAQVTTQFADVKEILDKCLHHGGGSYVAPSPGSAVQFRHRCYTFRKAYREAVAPAASPYDRLTIRKLAPGSTRVEIAEARAPGVFIPADGDPVQVEPPVEDDDPLFQEAMELRRRLDLE